MRRDRDATPGMAVLAGLLAASSLMVGVTVAVRAIAEAMGW